MYIYILFEYVLENPVKNKEELNEHTHQFNSGVFGPVVKMYLGFFLPSSASRLQLPANTDPGR